MEQLEDSTLDLIYRRRVHSFHQAYVIMILIMGILVALPLVKLDIVVTTAGMVRPLKEPYELFAPISGILDSTIIKNNLWVSTGDTIAWIRRRFPDTRIREYERIIRRNHRSLSDISSLLSGEPPALSSHIVQSYSSHLATLEHLEIRKRFLHTEYTTAIELFRQEVIARHEFEMAKMNYQLSCAEITHLEESYRNQLEEELYRLKTETSGYQGEIAMIRSTLQDYFITAPGSGSIQNCPGLRKGSVIGTGSSLGIISPAGPLVAECYIPPGKSTGISPGTKVTLRFNGPHLRHHSRLVTEVDYISNDVSLVNGSPAYRIRCTLDQARILRKDGSWEPVIKGMTFSANLVLSKQTLASLLFERVGIWANPLRAEEK